MSMNIFIQAEREIYIPKIKQKDVQREIVEVWQTPTNVSYKIAAAVDPWATYAEWVLKNSKADMVDVYAKDDYFSERNPIGTREVHYGKEHLAKLRKTISALVKKGYTIQWLVR